MHIIFTAEKPWTKFRSRFFVFLSSIMERICNTMNTEHNFTTGNIAGGLIKFALPLLLANVLMAGYNLIDMLVVGRYCGSAGVAAVGNASMICFIISSIGLGITIGGTVLIARARGGGDKAGEHRITGALFTVTAIASLPVSLMGWYFSRTVFIWIGVPVESLSAACNYISIISAGTLPVFGYNAVCAFFRGVGDSLRPLLIITVAAVMNVLLDFYFTGYCGYGVAGVAFATVLAQLAALFIGLNCMKKRGFLSGLSWRDFLPVPDIVLGLLKIGIPGALQMTVVNLAFLLVTGMFNHYGVAAAAAAGIGLKVSTLAGMPSWALGQAVTTAAAQNMGGGKLLRAAGFVRCGVMLGLLSTGTAVIFIQLFAGEIVLLFDGAAEVVELCVHYLRIFCSFSGLAYAAMYIYNSFALGTGAPMLALFNSLLEAVVLRLLLCWVLAYGYGLGFSGLCWGMALSTLPPALIGFLYYRFGRWRRQKQE